MSCRRLPSTLPSPSRSAQADRSGCLSAALRLPPLPADPAAAGGPRPPGVWAERQAAVAQPPGPRPPLEPTQRSASGPVVHRRWQAAASTHRRIRAGSLLTCHVATQCSSKEVHVGLELVCQASCRAIRASASFSRRRGCRLRPDDAHDVRVGAAYPRTLLRACRSAALR